jgi:hypothetical protein
VNSQIVDLTATSPEGLVKVNLMRKFSTRREADGGRQKRPSKGILYLVS